MHPNKNFRITIKQLLVYTVVFAVSSLLIAKVNVAYGVLLIAIAIGIESGRRSEYPVVLMAFCGLVAGLFVVLAIGGTWVFNIEHFDFAVGRMNQLKSVNGKMVPILTSLIGVLWFAAGGIFVWMIRAAVRGTRPRVVKRLEIPRLDQSSLPRE